MRSVFLKSVRAFNLALFLSNKEIIHTNKQQKYEKRYKCTILTAEIIKRVCCNVNALFEGKKALKFNNIYSTSHVEVTSFNPTLHTLITVSVS